eukprot:scaffold795_cov187-Amphora_coffeaeformis.AAC.24
MTCFYGATKSGPLLEHFFQLPSPDTLALLDIEFNNDAIEFNRGIADGGVMNGFTWPTLNFRMYAIMEERDSALLRHHLPKKPVDKFVKLNRNSTLCGSKSGGNKNAQATSPREATLQAVLSDLDPVLEGDISYTLTDPTCSNIRAKLAPLQGENYSQLRQSEAKRLGDGHVQFGARLVGFQSRSGQKMFYLGTSRIQRHDGFRRRMGTRKV